MSINKVFSKLDSRRIDIFYLLLLIFDDFSLLPEIFDIFGRENALKFIDIFAGQTISIPTVETLEKSTVDADIYVSLHGRPQKEFDAIVQRLAEKHDVSIRFVKDKYAKVHKLLESFYGVF